MTSHQQANISIIFTRSPFERVEQPGQEASFTFPRRDAVTSLTALQPGNRQVSHRVAEHVEGVDGNRQGKTRPERQPGGHLHVLKPFPAEHPSPAGNLDGQSESEETQRRLGNDDASDVDREDDEEGRHDIGQDMADQDLGRGGAHGPGCQKIVILFNAHHGASDDSGATDASGNPQDQAAYLRIPAPCFRRDKLRGEQIRKIKKFPLASQDQEDCATMEVRNKKSLALHLRHEPKNWE